MTGSWAVSIGWQSRLILMGRDQNGYGVRLRRSQHPGFGTWDDNNYATIIKARGNTKYLGDQEGATWTESEGATPTSEAQVGTAYDGFIHYYLRLEQATDGDDVTIKLWHTNSNDTATSVDNPDLEWVEDGSAYGSILDLRDLHWVGLTSECSSGNQNGPGAGAWFDDVRVEYIPPPPQGTAILIR